jgi:hypothetical protein
VTRPASTQTVEQARAAYFRALGCQEVDYDAFWLRLPLYGVMVTVPNPPAHGRALRFHDLHHPLTGYDTSLVGEAEISAWELASGPGRYVAAIGFDLAGTGLGLCVAPRRTFAAWVRGRRSRNLFRSGYAPALLRQPLDDVRRELGLEPSSARAPSPAPRLGDYASFALAAAAGVLVLATWPVSWVPIALCCLAPAPPQ